MATLSPTVKWSAGLVGRLARGQKAPAFDRKKVAAAVYRPFTQLYYYADPFFSDRLTANHAECFGPQYGSGGEFFAITAPAASRNFSVLAISTLADWHFLGDTVIFPLTRRKDGQVADNVTDWAFNKFVARYKKLGQKPRAKGQRAVTKQSIFHYCYAVLHDPVYRQKYATNLNRELPRIPFYPNFWEWADWGRALMSAHSEYSDAQPFMVQRHDKRDKQARAAGLSPKPVLRSYAERGEIVIDTETSLTGVPLEAWLYKLGHQSAIDWVLEQSKEKRSSHETFAESFAEYDFGSRKENLIELLRRIITVSIATVAIMEEMKLAER